MTGPEHYRAGEELIAEITQPDAMSPQRRILQAGDHAEVIALAQAHFTAALAAATALANYCGGRMTEGDSRGWFTVASAHPEHLRRMREAERADMEALAEEGQA